MFKLVIQDDEGKTTVVPLIRDEITIGRKEGNTIRLTERNVSRRHARILRNNGDVQIEDLGSYNGIRVNNSRIAERVSLRISDQVQIGDYKLYLKAEGVEQVDDARTMPIERIDQNLATEVMPAQPPAVANGTTPLPAIAPGAPAPIPGTPNPNRSPAAVADTDPSGRPVATAAQVAALTQPVGYGKLVIVSSNFAGKEFDLTRPQMIVGRTDENDIVINHRSISRNHAKVTRDPESGRYTISDLQSSNGVRVNGQDYGKVELRRGDTVDLGHVRFRFVEPGEDFVFARDAVIADINEGGGKKGLLVAIILGVLVLGGAGAFFALQGKKEGNVADHQGSGTNGQNTNGGGSGSQMVATNDNGGGSQAAGGTNAGAGSETTTNNGSGDNPGPGSDSAVKPDDAAAQIAIECKQFATDKKWPDALKCADRLASTDPKGAKAMKQAYAQEQKNELSADHVSDAIRDKNYAKAKKELANIPEDSVYRQDAQKAFDDFEQTQVDLYVSSATAAKRANKCGEIDKLIAKAKEEGLSRAVEPVSEQKCTVVAGNNGGNSGNTGGNSTPPPVEKDCTKEYSAACKKVFCNANPDDSHCSSGVTQVQAPANCDAEAAKDKGMTFINQGQHAAALSQFEASLRCKDDSYVRQLAFMESCASGNSPKAKQYYKKLSPAQQAKFAQICIRQKPPVDYQ